MGGGPSLLAAAGEPLFRDAGWKIRYPNLSRTARLEGPEHGHNSIVTSGTRRPRCKSPPSLHELKISMILRHPGVRLGLSIDPLSGSIASEPILNRMARTTEIPVPNRPTAP